MKLIHLADVHLDSSMESNFPKSLARERRSELLATFRRLVAYGQKEGVRGLLIAGDFFDSDIVSKETASLIYKEILENPSMDFFYLRGNHDKSGVFNKFDTLPQNLKLFSDSWCEYSYFLENGKKIVILGIEEGGKYRDGFYETLSLREEDFNIVLLHGELTDYKNDRPYSIEIKQFYYKNIDYMALGHIHKYKKERLLPRGEYCYSGCLEGRGFDELEEKGFVLLEIDEEKLSYETQFIPFAQRRLFELQIEVTDLYKTSEIAKKIIDLAKDKGITEKDILKVNLIGYSEEEERQDVGGIFALLETEFYYVKIYDRVKLKIRAENFEKEASLKGEFIRLVDQDSTLSEDEREEIIRYGLRVLRGEELEI